MGNTGIKCTICRAESKSDYTTEQNVKIAKIVKLCNNYLFEKEKQPARLIRVSRIKKYLQDNKPTPINKTLSYLENNYVEVVPQLIKLR